VEFRVSSELKNIIGKDLIINDEVAIFELVKNAYDAHATRVDITFEKNKIIIQDNGKGMDLDDIKNKWLFVAYSAKKDATEDDDLKKDDKYKDYRDKINLKRGFAGAKGIGRFSCDRLGSSLKLISKKVSSNKFHQLDINWDDFEKNAHEDFIDIQVDYSSPSTIEYSDFQNGVILEISNLHSKWNDINSLKKSLGKLIDPFQVNTKSNNFQIYIKESNKIFPEPVINNLVSVLTMKTTKLEVEIKEKKIISTLTDRGTIIYKIEENNLYSHLHNTSIVLLFLNRKAKHNFSQIMKVQPVEFGHVLLYNNGFRVYPYGEELDDSFGINRRHQQGYNRYLSTRNIIGNININEYSKQFKEKTSRDSGLIETEGYKELEKFFWDKALKRLEKYVVGIQWGLDELTRDKDNDSEDLTVLNTIESKSKIIELIKKLTSSKNIKILDFGSEFLNIINEYNIDEPIVKNLLDIAQKSNKPELIDEVDKLRNQINNLATQKSSLEKNLYDTTEKNLQLEQEKDLLNTQLSQEKDKTTNLVKEKAQTEKQILFLQSERTLNEKDLINLQHHIGINAELINGSITSFKRKMDKKETITKNEVMEILDEISMTNQKILAINKYATKADFITNSETIHKDIIAFIQQYIINIYKVVSNNQISIHVDNTMKEFVTNFKPMEMTIIIDNILNNARKAKAKNLNINFEFQNNQLLIVFIDDGNGFSSDITNTDMIFERGFTTTKGSGLGLYHIKQIIASMNGNIEAIKNKSKGIRLLIRLNK
jgi:signal transduction histidine kinase